MCTYGCHIMSCFLLQACFYLSPQQFALLSVVCISWRMLDNTWMLHFWGLTVFSCHKNVFSFECLRDWQFLKVALSVRGSAWSSAWHVGNEGLVVSFQQQTHRGRPRWWQVSADCTLQLSHIHCCKQTVDRRDPIYHQARLTAQGSALKKSCHTLVSQS